MKNRIYDLHILYFYTLKITNNATNNKYYINDSSNQF